MKTGDVAGSGSAAGVGVLVVDGGMGIELGVGVVEAVGVGEGEGGIVVMAETIVWAGVFVAGGKVGCVMEITGD